VPASGQKTRKLEEASRGKNLAAAGIERFFSLKVNLTLTLT